jgi:magnesium-transporting ATPase (P-type)
VSHWQELVTGDVIELKAGDKIPADIRVVETQNGEKG